MTCDCSDNNRPTCLNAGDSATWTETVCADCVDTGSAYEVAYLFDNLTTGERFRAAASVVDEVATFTLTPEQTSHFTAGSYALVKIYTQSGSRKSVRLSARLTVYPDPEGRPEPSHAQKMVVAIEAELERRATGKVPFVESSSISGNQIDTLSTPELREQLQRYRFDVEQERNRRKIAAGKKSKNLIRFRF